MQAIQIYKQTQYRLAEYLVGVIAGYLMYTSAGRKSKLKKSFVTTFWIISIGFITFHVFCPLKPKKFDAGGFVYESIYRELWTCSISWIIFACHHLKSGKIVRSFLSQDFWRPLSKISLSVYLTHYIYIALTHYNQKEVQWIGVWWEIHVHIADVVISFAVGGLFYLIVEAPTSRLVRLLFKN